MIMSRKIECCVLIAMLCGAVPAARAQNVYQTGFEDPPFVAGQPLVGQDGWVIQLFNGSPLGPNAAISTAHPASGLQSVLVQGADLTPTGVGYDVGSYRKFVDFDVAAAGSPIVRIQADMRLDGPLTPQTDDRVTGDFLSVNLVAFSTDGNVGEMSLSSDGHAYSYSAGGSYLFERPVSLGQYQQLGMDLDFAAGMTTYRLNGEILGTQPFADGFMSEVLNRGSLVVYAVDPDPLGRDRNAYTAYYDNFSIAVVPEPNGWGPLMCSVIGAVAIWRRRSNGST